MKNSGLGGRDLKKRTGVSSGTLLGVTNRDALTNAGGSGDGEVLLNVLRCRLTY